MPIPTRTDEIPTEMMMRPIDQMRQRTAHDTITDALGQKDPDAEVVVDRQGRKQADSDLRDYENVPLTEEIDDYFEREVQPYVPDAWVDEDYTRVGYEIPFTRYFYEYEPPRPVEEIEGEIRSLERDIRGMLDEVVG